MRKINWGIPCILINMDSVILKHFLKYFQVGMVCRIDHSGSDIYSFMYDKRQVINPGLQSHLLLSD